MPTSKEKESENCLRQLQTGNLSDSRELFIPVCNNAPGQGEREKEREKEGGGEVSCPPVALVCSPCLLNQANHPPG